MWWKQQSILQLVQILEKSWGNQQDEQGFSLHLPFWQQPLRGGVPHISPNTNHQNLNFRIQTPNKNSWSFRKSFATGAFSYIFFRISRLISTIFRISSSSITQTIQEISSPSPLCIFPPSFPPLCQDLENSALPQAIRSLLLWCSWNDGKHEKNWVLSSSSADLGIERASICEAPHSRTNSI